MPARIIPVAGVSAAALVAAATFASTAGAQEHHVTSSSQSSVSSLVKFHPSALSTCYKQLANDNGTGIVSQNFTANAEASYDSRGADDFKLKSACQVKRVDVAGRYFKGNGLADSENVIFYRNYKGKPGGVISSQQNLAGVDDGTGNLKITLNSPVGLKSRRYWVSVQVNMDFGAGGEWGWLTNNTRNGNPAVWRNQGDGFGTGCINFTKLRKCISNHEGPDFVFALSGS